MRASLKFKRNPDCRVRICRYGLPARKKGVGKSCEWTPSEPSRSSQGLEPPHVLGVRSFNDFTARRNTPAFPTVRPDRPDLEQVFSQCTQRQKKRVGMKGGCGEKDMYDAAQIVRFTHADSDGDDLDEEDIEGDEEDCDDDPKKVGRKTPSRGTRCECRVRCQYNKKSDEYKITTLNLKHTCPGHLHKWRGPTSKALWMRSICQDIISGCQQQSFSQIPSLCAQISEVDPNAVVDWHRFDGTCVFMRAFVSPSACRNVLRYYQKYVALDVCFTKNKKYPTQLFIATAVDGNSQVVPLAYAVAPTENYENWRWFIQNLMASIEGLESRNVIIVSDRQKGLEKAVAEVLPRNFHMHCAHHLKMNVIKHFGAAAVKAFLTLVYMDSQAIYERRLDKKFQRPGPCAIYTSNPSGSICTVCYSFAKIWQDDIKYRGVYNGALKPVRDYAPCHIIWQMWNYMVNLFYARREKARESSEALIAFATKRMKEIVQNCGSFVAMSADENEALVQTDGGRKQWRLTKVPTRKSIRNGRQRIVRIPNGGSARSAESEFSYPIQDDPVMNPAAVMTNVSQEDGGERGNPPVPQSSAPQGEQLSQAPPVARSRGSRCCGACKQPGHTRRTCPTLRQYRRAEVQEGLDVVADG
ncbi:hypothetical protein R1sor_012999 [Riccia sorocarpa]|uniref:MULE transposase domain-containing protein n=1 Tax=Riccia sorocarpa TaxID=122646 RepID=A0ABD3H8U2_9MARC